MLVCHFLFCSVCQQETNKSAKSSMKNSNSSGGGGGKDAAVENSDEVRHTHIQQDVLLILV